MLPVCGSNSPTNCNGWLNRPFEVAGKPQGRTVFNDLRPIAGAEVVAAARWVVKTLLLHAHPLAMNSEIGHLDTASRSVLELPKSALLMMRNSGQSLRTSRSGFRWSDSSPSLLSDPDMPPVAPVCALRRDGGHRPCVGGGEL